MKCTTKLTGAGGGECTYTFVEHAQGETTHDFQSRLHQIRHAIESLSSNNYNHKDDKEQSYNKFECLVNSIGNHGVLWCWKIKNKGHSIEIKLEL